MGRTLGPFTDVSTARVDGAYEIYEGIDEEGRAIEILTLGKTSAKDPARRALLSDTVSWAHATRGPADSPILASELHGEEPYVVTLQQSGYRGVERLMERMLAMGPSSGPLPTATGQNTGHIPIVGYHTNPHGIPTVPSVPPLGSPVAPASPMTSYASRTKSSRPAWLIPTVVVLSVLILVTGGFLVISGMDEDTVNSASDSPSAGSDDFDSQKEAQPSPGTEEPRWDGEIEPVMVMGNATFDAETGRPITPAGWPFAFKVPEGSTCDLNELEATCNNPESDMGVEISLRPCAEGCGGDERERIGPSWPDDAEVQEIDQSTKTAKIYQDNGSLSIQLSRFFEPTFNWDEPMHVLVAVKVPADAPDDGYRVINDVRTQTS